MSKKIFYLLLFFFLSNCGYEAIYSKKNIKYFNFAIDELIFTGDRKVNIKLKEKLFNYTKKEKLVTFNLLINTQVIKTISAKDALGDPTIFQLEVRIIVKVLNQQDLHITTLNYVEKYKYRNDNNRVELKKYEDEVKTSIAETFAKEISLSLSRIR